MPRTLRAFSADAFDNDAFDVEMFDEQPAQDESWNTKPKQPEALTPKSKQSEAWAAKPKQSELRPSLYKPSKLLHRRPRQRPQPALVFLAAASGLPDASLRVTEFKLLSLPLRVSPLRLQRLPVCDTSLTTRTQRRSYQRLRAAARISFLSSATAQIGRSDNDQTNFQSNARSTSAIASHFVSRIVSSAILWASPRRSMNFWLTPESVSTKAP